MTVDERVILPMLVTIFHALQLPYYRSSPSSRPSVMVSRIPWKWLDLSQLTRKRLFEEMGAHLLRRRYRVRKIVSDAGWVSASTGLFDETMITVKWIPTWRKVYQFNTSRKQIRMKLWQLPLRGGWRRWKTVVSMYWRSCLSRIFEKLECDWIPNIWKCHDGGPKDVWSIIRRAPIIWKL